MQIKILNNSTPPPIMFPAAIPVFLVAQLHGIVLQIRYGTNTRRAFKIRLILTM